MIIRLNGKALEVEDKLSIAGLLAKAGIDPKGTAVELNSEVVPRANHATTILKQDDKVEVIRAFGGG